MERKRAPYDPDQRGAAWRRVGAGAIAGVGVRAAVCASLIAVALAGPMPSAAAPQAGTCEPTLGLRLDAGEVALGAEVGVAVDVDPRCSTEPLPRHYMLALAAWPDAGSTGAVRDMAVAFVRSLGSTNKVGATLGDQATPRTVAVGSPVGTVEAWLQSHQPAATSASLADLVRAAHNAFGSVSDPDTGVSTLPAGRRHIVVVGHRDLPLGRPVQLQFDLEADRDNAIAVDLLCIGGGCPVVAGLPTQDVVSAEQVGTALTGLQARPARTELAWLRLRGWLGTTVEYVFASAAPPAERLGRAGSGTFAEWRQAGLATAQTFTFRVSPLTSGLAVAAGPVELEGVTSAGLPVRAGFADTVSLPVLPRPDMPSACRLRAAAAAGPDPVDLGARAAVTMTLRSDCPSAPRPVDVVLAIDRSSSMLTGERLGHVKTAARAFIDQIDLDRSRVAVLAFGTRVEELAPLGNDRPTLLAAIERITAEGDTAMAGGLHRAREMLAARRPGALPVIVLLSDGVIHDEPQPEADWAHVEGVRVVAVCVNAEAACATRFRPLAAPASYFLATTDPDELARHYGELARYLGQTDFDRLAVTVTSSPVFSYRGARPGHDAPRVGTAGQLTWEQADPLFGRTRLAYDVTAVGPGRWPIAGDIRATWRDSDGGVGAATIAVPELTVRAPDDTGPCQAERLDRAVAPDHVPVGATVATTLTVDLACAGAPVPLEIALVVDHSYSMRGQRLADTRAAIDALLADTHAPEARFALVAFHNAILARVPLTADRARIRSTLAGLAVSGETNIGAAIDAAVGLLADARPGARRFIVLLTDGYNSTGAQPIVPAATGAIEAGVEVIAVCAGGVCDADLRRAVSQPSFYFSVPDSAGLTGLYRRLATALSGLLPIGLEIADQPGPALVPVPGSAAPAPQLSPNPDVWQLGFPPEDGTTIARRLSARQPGRHPATLWTRVAYLVADGRRGEMFVPPAAVTVDGEPPDTPPTALPLPTSTPTATATPPPTATPPATATVTARPVGRVIHLPWVGRGGADGAGQPASTH